MSAKLYGIPGSPYVQAAMLGLAEKGVEYELMRVVPPEHKGAEHLARHPFGKVPAFEHDGFALYETQAILRYVNRAFPGPELEPADPRAVARMNQIIGMVDCYMIRAWSADISFERIMAPRFFGRPCDEAKVAAALPQARICAEAVEALLGPGPYLAGDTLSLADLHLAPHYNYFRQTPEGETMLANKPRLAEWFGRMGRRESVTALLPG